MKYFIIISVLIFSLNISTELNAQIWELNLAFPVVKIDGTYVGSNTQSSIYSFENKVLHYALNGGVNLPVYKIKEELILGLQLNAYIGKLGATLKGVDGNAPYPDFNFGLPAYLTLRYGGGSYKESNKVFGLGVGLGYQFVVLVCDLANLNDEDNGEYYFAQPSIMFEVAIDRSHKVVIFDNIKFRFETFIGKKNYDYNFNGQNYYYRINQTTFTIVFCY
jgi:hypothetical protein